jgi:hypothetical protein
MDTWLKNFIVQIAIFGTAVYCLVGLTRRVFEAAFPSLKRAIEDDKNRKPYPNTISRWWNEVILYFLSPGWGVAVAMFIRETGLFPDSFKQWQMAVVFGIAFGSISSLLYKLLIRVIGEKAGVSVDSTTTMLADSTSTGEKTPESDDIAIDELEPVKEPEPTKVDVK